MHAYHVCKWKYSCEMRVHVCVCVFVCVCVRARVRKRVRMHARVRACSSEWVSTQIAYDKYMHYDIHAYNANTRMLNGTSIHANPHRYASNPHLYACARVRLTRCNIPDTVNFSAMPSGRKRATTRPCSSISTVCCHREQVRTTTFEWSSAMQPILQFWRAAPQR